LTTFNWDEPIANDLLREALQSLVDLLGNTIIISLISALERRGIILDGENAYPLRRVRDELVLLFGEEGASVIVYFIRKYVQDHRSH
jgi:hypothetical protein